MLQHEFEELIGREVTTEEYAEANAMYMAAGEMDKAEFCREWTKIGKSRLVACLYETAHRLNQDLQERKLMLEETQSMLSDAADAMLLAADRWGTEQGPGPIAKGAVFLIGQKEVTRRKVAAGYRLDGDDQRYIINNLK